MSNPASGPPRTLTTVSGRRREIPLRIAAERIAGLDAEGRIVVDDFDALAHPFKIIDGQTHSQHLFGLTLCCNASDKGVEDGVVCRGCYGDEEIGNYLWPTPEGTFPGLDPVAYIG